MFCFFLQTLEIQDLEKWHREGEGIQENTAVSG